MDDVLIGDASSWSSLLPSNRWSISPLGYELGEVTCSSFIEGEPLPSLSPNPSMKWYYIDKLPHSRSFYGKDRPSLIARALIKNHRFYVSSHIAVARRNLCDLSQLFIKHWPTPPAVSWLSSHFLLILYLSMCGTQALFNGLCGAPPNNYIMDALLGEKPRNEQYVHHVRRIRR
jgi:hypothetical protein